MLLVYFYTSLRAAEAPPGGVVDGIWQYLSASVPAGAVLNGLGLGTLALLFARDLILTRGQHLRRSEEQKAAHADIVRIMGDTHRASIAELVTHHTALDAVKDERYAEMRDRMAYYRDARLEEKARADKVTDQLVEFAELAKLNTHVLKSIDEAARDTKP